MSLLVSFAQTSYEVSTSKGSNPVQSLFQLVTTVATLAGMWKIFIKAGFPGWAAIVPFYNIYIANKVAKQSNTILLLWLIPILGWLIWAVMTSLNTGKQFGKDGVWSFFLLFIFGFVGYPMLGFGKDVYGGAAPVAAGPAPMPPQNPVV